MIVWKQTKSNEKKAKNYISFTVASLIAIDQYYFVE